VALLIVGPIVAFVFTGKRVNAGSSRAKKIGWSLRIVSLVPWIGIISLLVWVAATSRDYDPDVTKWVEVERPTDPAEKEIWFYAADYSDAHWFVTRNGDQVRAHLFGWREVIAWMRSRLWFAPRTDNFEHYRSFPVRDGWLVGFNEGEFGAALYWFSSDGQRNYKVSDDQVVDFMSTPRGIIAIQGLAHLGMSEGSIIRIAPDARTGRWSSAEIMNLPEAPRAFMRLNNGRMFLALSGALAVIPPDNQLETLVKPTDWVAANTIAASADASKIYVGALQYVCEYDTATKRFRYLIPNLSFLNKLPKEQEERMRRTYH
jgi:hypothetical protein